jgi:predicted metal-binding transcription factor (methanogenesis marker protein 9)
MRKIKIKKPSETEKVKDGWRPPLEQKTCFAHGVWCCEICIAARDERRRREYRDW